MTAPADPTPPTSDVAVPDVVTPPPPAVSDAGVLIRIGTMMQSLREEVREMTLDEAARQRLTDIHRRAVEAVMEVLSDDLRGELADLALPLGDAIPTAAELQVAQAQLVGWLDGLFRGIQTAVVSQQMSAQRQLQELRQGRGPDGRAQGQYL